MAMLVLTHMPVSGPKGLPLPYFDKLVHFVMFSLLVLVGWRHHRTLERSGSARFRLTWGAIYLAYAAMDEWTQPLFGRTMSLGDWVADAAGVVVMSAILHFRSRPHGLSEPVAREPRQPVERG